MLAIAERNRKPAHPLRDPLPLENGARLTAREFLRRYEAMPEVKKAELIEGIVFVNTSSGARWKRGSTGSRWRTPAIWP